MGTHGPVWFEPSPARSGGRTRRAAPGSSEASIGRATIPPSPPAFGRRHSRRSHGATRSGKVRADAAIDRVGRDRRARPLHRTVHQQPRASRGRSAGRRRSMRRRTRRSSCATKTRCDWSRTSAGARTSRCGCRCTLRQSHHDGSLRQEPRSRGASRRTDAGAGLMPRPKNAAARKSREAQVSLAPPLEAYPGRPFPPSSPSYLTGARQDRRFS